MCGASVSGWLCQTMPSTPVYSAEALYVFDDVDYVLFAQGVTEEVRHEVRSKACHNLRIRIDDRPSQVLVVSNDGFP